MTPMTSRRRPSIGGLIAAVAVLVVLAPQPSRAAACVDRLRQPPQRLTGSYVAAGESYARSFVFAMLVDCKGKQEVVTVQRATGRLPVCGVGQPVEVLGTLVWTKYLVDGHYEINEPSAVTCRTVAEAAPPAPTTSPVVTPEPRPASPPVSAATPPALAAAPAPKTTTPGVWHGSYQDSRGAGAATFMLVRGTTTVSGTWRLRTGGGGPVTGMIDRDGRRIQLRMENVSPECPGTLEGAGDISDTSLTAVYRGQDCEGGITEGRLELRLQTTTP